MIDADAGIGDVSIVCTRPFGKHFRGALNAVAESRNVDVCISLHSFAKHSHRIGVIKHKCIRTYLFHILANIQHQRNIPKCSEDARNASRVANVYVDTVFHRNLDLVSPDIHVAVKYGHDDRIRILECRFA